MSLDDAYFDAIHIDVVKKKYYNANKVEAVFSDIRARAGELNRENERLRSQLAVLEDRKVEIGDAVLSAQTLYREIVDRARERAEAVEAEAEQKAQAILRRAEDEAARIRGASRRQEDYAVTKVQELIDQMRRRHLDSIEALNGLWQDFLCGLMPEEEAAAESPAADGEESVRADMEEKIGRIAKELFSMGAEEASGAGTKQP